MENPFKRFNDKPKQAAEEYQPDPQLLELVMTEARKIDSAASEADIRGASVRAMRAAEVSGTPFTKDSFEGDEVKALDGELSRALEIEQEGQPSSILVVDANTDRVLRAVGSKDEARKVIEEERAA